MSRFSEEIYTDIFGDAVEPAVKRSVCAEGVDGTKRLYSKARKYVDIWKTTVPDLRWRGL